MLEVRREFDELYKKFQTMLQVKYVNLQQIFLDP